MNLQSRPYTPSPEFLTLLWCTNTLFRVKDEAPIAPEHLASRSFDWDRLLGLAHAHACLPAVHDALAYLETPATPDGVSEAFEERRKSIACSNLERTGELLRLLTSFQGKQLRVIAYKGPVLAYSCYGNISLREFGDLDLLVDKQDVAACAGILKAEGYKHTRHYQWEDTFLKVGHGEVDIHTSLTPWTFPVPVRFEELWEHACKVHLADVDVYTFCPEHNLLVLCIQICKDAWEDRLTLNKVCDVAALLRAQPLDWHFLSQVASSNQASRIIYFGLALTKSLLAVDIPDNVLTEISQYSWLDKRVSETRDRVADIYVRRPSDILRRIQLHFSLQEHFSGKIAQVGVPFCRGRKVEGSAE